MPSLALVKNLLVIRLVLAEKYIDQGVFVERRIVDEPRRFDVVNEAAIGRLALNKLVWLH